MGYFRPWLTAWQYSSWREVTKLIQRTIIVSDTRTFLTRIFNVISFQTLWFRQEGQGRAGEKIVKETKINYCRSCLEDIKESKIAQNSFVPKNSDKFLFINPYFKKDWKNVKKTVLNNKTRIISRVLLCKVKNFNTRNCRQWTILVENVLMTFVIVLTTEYWKYNLVFQITDFLIILKLKQLYSL